MYEYILVNQIETYRHIQIREQTVHMGNNCDERFIEIVNFVPLYISDVHTFSTSSPPLSAPG
jgi:hypothetical protein